MVEREALIRGACFVVGFALIAVWETVHPRRGSPRRPARWPVNLGLSLLNTAVVRLLAPAAGVSAALWNEGQGWGLLSHIGSPVWASIVVTVVCLDFAVYLQHRLFHRIPLLWRAHRVHHTDPEFDVSTGVRFHPAEMAFSTVYKAAAIVALGAPAAGVLLFEVALNLGALFSHADARLPARLDRRLRRLVVTPDMHRVHHSTDPAEQRRNFGFTLSWWDYLFATYAPAPREPHDRMPLGVRGWHADEMTLIRLLAQPLEADRT